jgi:D-arabinitol dehydrogenase (NADP+)
MKALSIGKPGHSEVINRKRPQAGTGQIVIEVACCGVCGTDVHIFRGEYLGDYPIIPGHEFAGTVIEVGAGVSRFHVGDRVAVEPNLSCGYCEACLNNRQNFCENWQGIGVTLSGGMAEYVVSPEAASFNIGVLPFRAAAFMEPLSCVLHGVNKLVLPPGSRVAVFGAGPIGMQLVRTLRALGAGRITVVDRNQDRLTFAKQDGVDETVADVSELPADRFDSVIEATGAPALVQVALNCVHPGGEVLLFGVPPQKSISEIEPFQLFRKGVSLHGSYTSLRNSYQALELLSTGRIRVDDLISHTLPLDEFGHGVSVIEKGAERVMKVMMVPR